MTAHNDDRPQRRPPATTTATMFIAVRCPRCLLTVYTTFVADGALGFSVSSLTDEDLLFYNCPLRLCEYHIPTFHHVNFYFNPTNAMGMSHGFRVSPRTADTKPFRTPAQIAALAITFGYGGEGLRRPPAMAPQVHDKAQAAPEKQAVEEQETDREDNQDGAAVAPVADTV
jgi:hypothetical protein